ncbi:alpha-2,8-sialyltransferase 8F isoform X2 [Mobula birostris]|uniref:alpha-2,8-sialyltransferase 8F isoform X2 n=1 Tax=Mobula birostris TaxID=1983395 RepID=UPI003B28B9F8
MAAMCSFRTLLLSCAICIFLLGIIHFEYSFDYRYMGRLSKLKFSNVFSPILQVNDSEEKSQNESDRDDGECEMCTSSQQLNFWSAEEWNSTDCEKTYKWIATSPIQWQTEDDIIKMASQIQHCPWHHQGAEATEFRLELKRCCHAAYNCLVTQRNTPVGTELTYEAEPKKKIKIHHQIFAIFPKDSSLRSQQYKRCAVVGNSGILTNSSCGAEINKADFVFRYGELQDRRRPFFTNLTIYNDALLLLPAFSYTKNTILSFRALYTLQDFQAKQKVVFFNPVYLKHLSEFWRSKGVRANRLSTGIMVTSMALELCKQVLIYGFWPFKENVDGQAVSHHYFDNQLPKPDIHSMPLEYQQLLQMHSKGIVKLQMAPCQIDP